MKCNKIWWRLSRISDFQMVNDGYMRYIFNRKRKGLYVVILGVERGFASHCVAIDCNNKRLIYDCMENYVLSLNRKNLEYCVGSYHAGVISISHCFKITMKPGREEALNLINERKRKHDEI